MNKTFRFLIIAFFIIQFGFSNAQNFGIKGGLNLSTMLSKDNDQRYSDNFSAITGIHFGFTYEHPLTNIVSVSSEILLSNKGMKYDFSEDEAKISSDIKLYYIDLPVMLKSRYDLGNGMKLYGATGPYVGIGLRGQSQTSTVYQDDSTCEKRDIEWGTGPNDNLRRLDWGWTFSGGLQIEKIELGIAYDVGFANIAANRNNGTIARNRVVKASIAYQFGK
ncbi:MAG: porin family protein [Draconibacterium sp.]